MADLKKHSPVERVSRDGLLSEIITRLVGNFAPEEIYLFGSRARGTEKPGSDFDLLVIVRELEAPGYRYSQKAHELLWGLRKSADIFFMTRENFEKSKCVVGTLPEIVWRSHAAGRRTGIPSHARHRRGNDASL